MKRTHHALKTWTLAGLMLTVTAVGAAVVVAVAVFGGGTEFAASDPAAGLGVGRAGMAVAQDSRIAHLFTPEVRGSTPGEQSVRSEIGLCPMTDLQSDNLWEARATVRCLRALDRSRGTGR